MNSGSEGTDRVSLTRSGPAFIPGFQPIETVGDHHGARRRGGGTTPELSRLARLARRRGQTWRARARLRRRLGRRDGRGDPYAHRKEPRQAPAILFDDVPGYAKGFRTLYGQLSSIKRIALTLGLPLDYERKVDIVQRYHARMQDLNRCRRASSTTARFSRTSSRATPSTC